MNQIEKPINNLSSPNKNTRYDSCEELRVTESLPESAIAALETATNDPDPLVGEATRHALEAHKSHPPIEESTSDTNDLPVKESPRVDKSSSLPGLKRRIRWLWFIFALLLGISLVGEYASIALSGKGWTRITEINGEDLSYIWTLSLAPDGAIWIGTSSPARVYRFDGTSWKEYTTDNSLSENDVRAIAESPGGELWIGTDNGVYRFDGKNWTSFTVADGLPVSIKSISIAPDGSVWVAGFRGISRFNGKTWTSYFKGDLDFTDIAVSTDNIVWTASSLGLFRFDGREWTTYKYEQFDTSIADFSILISGDQIWVSNYYGVVCFDGQKWISCPVADFIAVTKSPDGSLWFVSQDEYPHVKLSRFADDHWTFYTSPYHFEPHGRINDLVADQQSQIWVNYGDNLLISNPKEIVSSNISLILLGWNKARYGLFALTGIGLIILLININKSIRRDQKIYKSYNSTQSPVAEEPRKWNPLAITSFILSILVIVFLYAGPLFLDLLDFSDSPILILFTELFRAIQLISSPAAIVIGAVAILQIKRSGGRQKGIGFAIAGIAFQAIIYFCFGFYWWYYTYLHQ